MPRIEHAYVTRDTFGTRACTSQARTESRCRTSQVRLVHWPSRLEKKTSSKTEESSVDYRGRRESLLNSLCRRHELFVAMARSCVDFILLDLVVYRVTWDVHVVSQTNAWLLSSIFQNCRSCTFIKSTFDGWPCVTILSANNSKGTS